MKSTLPPTSTVYFVSWVVDFTDDIMRYTARSFDRETADAQWKAKRHWHRLWLRGNSSERELIKKGDI